MPSVTGGRLQTVDECLGSAPFYHPSSTLTRVPPSHRKGFPWLFEAVDSATSGKPFVQNDMLEAMRICSQVLETGWQNYE